MKKPPLITPASIASYNQDGRGVAFINGKTTFVSNALPQEEVICQRVKKHSRFDEAKTIEIIKPAENRITPRCQHYGVCGGCSLQHLDNESQIKLKQNILLNQLKHIGKVEPQNILPPLSKNFWNYRRKARLGVRFVIKKNCLMVGFRESFTNFLTDIKQCEVLHESIANRFDDLRTLISSLTIYDHIPQIEIAVSENKTALVFRHMQDLQNEDIKKLTDFGKNFNFDIYLQPGSPDSVHKIWPLNNDENLFYELNQFGIKIYFHPLNFTQVNAEINPLLINQALQLLSLSGNDVVLDLFCGLGNFTLPIAKFAKHVVGIEGSKNMTEKALQNAQLNKIHNVEFFAENLMQPNPHASWLQKKYSKILLDPPRSGAKEILPFLHAQKIVYISCNPATLARDAYELVYNHKYQLTSVGFVNMFPNTSHIEAIALFEKSNHGDC